MKKSKPIYSVERDVNKYEFNKGRGRTRISLSAHYMCSDLILYLYNQAAHIGAVAIGEYDHNVKRASTSVITRLGHKDDAVAQKAAHAISKHTERPTCVIVGIHLDNISQQEIDQILQNTSSLIDEFISLVLSEKKT